MNEVLHSFLCCFVLVFFDDILIYSPTWTKHLQHVRAVFQVLRDNKLAIKQSKCSFGTQEVAYLGHIINNLASPWIRRKSTLCNLGPPQRRFEHSGASLASPVTTGSSFRTTAPSHAPSPNC
jgi:hypothetical protein